MNKRKFLNKILCAIMVAVFLLVPTKGYSAACPATQWIAYTAVGGGCTLGYYETNCLVKYDDGGGEREYQANYGNFDEIPAAGGTAAWTDNGLCGVSPPTFTASSTTGAGSITCVSATAGGQVATDGDASGIAQRGICWNTTTAPLNTDNNVIEGGTTVGVMTAVAFPTLPAKLLASTLYYVRPYAINGNGHVGYGDEISFTTLALPTLAATDNPTNATEQSATSGGNITAAPCAITERGLAYHTATAPEITDNKVVEGGTTTGTFTANITGLTANTKYYIRAYATTDGGTSYGAETWLYTGGVPVVTTFPDINVFCESFSSGGGNPMTFERKPRVKPDTDAAGDFNTAYLEHGLIYGVSSADVTASTPTVLVGASVYEAHISNNFASLGQTVRHQEITGLTPATTYYFKYSATTSTGVGYGAVDNTTTSAACAEYYSCSGINTYHTDASCATAVATPTANSIVYYRHDWSDVPGTQLASLADITSQTLVTAKPYRIVMQSGGYIYTDNSYNAGTQLIINANSQFGFSGSPNMIVDGLTTPGQKFTRLTMNGGSFVSSAAMTNNIKIDAGSGEICNDGSFTNVSTAPGSVYGNYSGDGGITNTGKYNVPNAKCVGTFTLPIELISFDAVLARNKEVVLEWVTGSEINNDYFEVLCSADGKTWKKMNVVDGAGNSVDVNTYSSVDDDIEGYERKYYKLKQVDFDGSFSYSKVKMADLTGKGGILRAYDDGKNIHVYYEGIRGAVELSIYDIHTNLIPHGGLFIDGVKTKHIAVEKTSLSPGIYFIQLRGDGRSYSYKLFVK